MIGKLKKKKALAYAHFHVKRGDEVKVICGSNRGQSGKVLQILKKSNRVIVEGVNMLKKHTRKNQNNPKGGIEEREGTIHISNVKVVTKGDAKASSKAKK